MLAEATEHRLQEVFADHPAVRAAYVFGSVAADRERDRSDLDLGIVVDPGRWNSTDHKILLTTDCMEATERDRIDLVVLNDAPLVVQFEAVRPNVLLYARDDFHHGRFFSRGARMYWAHFRRQRKALKERLRETAHG
ncbi:type VII toxin-antitoxin system MntA family adenylyltransferase antitoxin [Salinibacter altiplanensis]|uniref:type VII toxin-antitoxin system MntA family adenylyltransferase antitoxin n=1 Tax=Salinibacter altiplanensis TaxID=1803181 RepID=UPI00131A1284|nr:nucleotidyltransferase domain-containing protein [Salinibacter altiplanensis]